MNHIVIIWRDLLFRCNLKSIFSAASLCETQTRPTIGIIVEESAIVEAKLHG
ncbi:hypothetical protein Plhal304r1_c003g0011231 [Plasmopara halstedii]